MDNEINLFDMLLAKKLGGGGSSALEEITFTATGWNELPAINIPEYFPATGYNIAFALGFLRFSFYGTTVLLPILVENLVAFSVLEGGACNSAGTAAAISLTYDSTDEVWSVAKAFTNLAGSWTDVTQAVQVGASDIELHLFK